MNGGLVSGLKLLDTMDRRRVSSWSRWQMVDWQLEVKKRSKSQECQNYGQMMMKIIRAAETAQMNGQVMIKFREISEPNTDTSENLSKQIRKNPVTSNGISLLIFKTLHPY